MQPDMQRARSDSEVAHLYVHVPFCPTICPFCNFHVLRRRDDLVAAYLRRLDEELVQLAGGGGPPVPLRTVYLGGGTPSHLHDDELSKLFTSIRRRFDVNGAEIGIEAHPFDVNAARARWWRDLGVTRVSLGVQSTDDDVLRRLGRPHDAATALAALDTIVEVGGWSVNADLIVAVPGQDVAADLVAVAERGVDHLAAYTLTIEPGTPFEQRGVSVDEEGARQALLLAGEILPRYGLGRYEVSNHARDGHRCAHNLAYWRGGRWFGAGPSATGQLPAAGGGCRLVRNPGFEDWLAGAPPDEERLDALDVARTRLLTGLRLTEGIDEADLWRHRPPATSPQAHPGPLLSAPRDPLSAVGDGWGELCDRVDALCRAGRLVRRDGRLFAAPDELPVLDRLTAELW